MTRIRLIWLWKIRPILKGFEFYHTVLWTNIKKFTWLEHYSGYSHKIHFCNWSYFLQWNVLSFVCVLLVLFHFQDVREHGVRFCFTLPTTENSSELCAHEQGTLRSLVFKHSNAFCFCLPYYIATLALYIYVIADTRVSIYVFVHILPHSRKSNKNEKLVKLLFKFSKGET